MFTTYVDQVAATLRDGLRDGRWTVTMPGGDRLAREMGVNSRTVTRALAQLEKEGLIQSQGSGRPRKIVRSVSTPSILHVRLILYERSNASIGYILELRRALERAGHQFSFASQTLNELKHDQKRVAKMMEAEPANAWIVAAGSRSVLEWLSEAEVPVFGLFGSFIGLPIAGTGADVLPALHDGLDCLYSLGHRRITMLTREERRVPVLGKLERDYLEKLEELGIRTGAYNLPDWKESADGLEHCLDGLYKSLFRKICG